MKCVKNNLQCVSSSIHDICVNLLPRSKTFWVQENDISKVKFLVHRKIDENIMFHIQTVHHLLEFPIVIL